MLFIVITRMCSLQQSEQGRQILVGTFIYPNLINLKKLLRISITTLVFDADIILNENPSWSVRTVELSVRFIVRSFTHLQQLLQHISLIVKFTLKLSIIYLH